MPSRAEREASALLARLGIDAPPIPVEDVANALGAEVIQERLDRRVSGLLYREPDRILIGVNAGQAPTRQRFSIAHECGHLLLHKGRTVFLDHRVNFRDETSSLAVDSDEIAANAFAAALLMPADLVLAECRRAAAQGRLSSTGFVKDLSRIFDVSQEAMTNRLSNLGISS